MSGYVHKYLGAYLSSCKRKEAILYKARQSGITYHFKTLIESEELFKCRNDISYFIENYCHIMTPNGLQKVKLNESQKKYLRKLQQRRGNDHGK